jgi:hypothetical protein
MHIELGSVLQIETHGQGVQKMNVLDPGERKLAAEDCVGRQLM